MRRQPAARGGGGRAAASAARAAARAAAGAAASGQVATAASERLDRARAPGAQASRALHHSLTSSPSQSQRRVHARRGDLVKRPDRRPYRGDHAQPARGRQSPRSRPSRSGAPLGNGGARRRVRVCRSPGAPSAPCFTSVSPMRTLIVTLGLCMALQPPPKRAAAVPNNLVCGTATRRAPAVPLPAKVLTPEQRVAIGIEH